MQPLSEGPSVQRNALLLAFGKVCTISVGIVSNILWARYTSQEVYGQYQLIVSLAAIASTYCMTGLNDSLAISSAKDLDGNFPVITRLRFAAAILCGGLFWLACRNIPSLLPLKGVAAIFAVCLPFIELGRLRSSWLPGKKLYSYFVLSNIAASALSLLTLILCIVLDLKSLMELALYLQVGQACLSVLYYLLMRWKTLRNTASSREVVHFGLHVTAATLVSGLWQTDKVIINQYLSVADVAIYSVAALFPAQIKTVMSVVLDLISPNLARADTLEDGWIYLKKRLISISAGFVALGIAGFVLFPFVIPIFFSDRYVQAVPYARWLWLIFALASPLSLIGVLLRSQQRKGALYYTQVLSPVATFGLYLVLVPRLGLYGAVAARGAVNFLSPVISIYFLKRYLGEERGRL